MPIKCAGCRDKQVPSTGAFCKPCAIQRAGSGATREQIRALQDPAGKAARSRAIYKADGRKKKENARNNARNNPRKCPHGKLKRNCIDSPCTTVEAAMRRGLVCKVCLTRRTRSGICKTCFETQFGLEATRIEAQIRCILTIFFPGIERSHVSLGGPGCARAVHGGPAAELSCEEKEVRKRAYPDLYLVTESLNLFIEIDENRHEYYDRACELARLDILQFGVHKEDLKESVLLRFNPHHVMHGGQKEELPDIDLRIKALIQTIRNELTPRTRLEIPVMRVKYLFYGTGSRQRANVEHASGTVVLCDDINDVDVSTLDEDIAEFSLLSLTEEDVLEGQNALITAKQIEMGSSEHCCEAVNHASDRARRKRCSQSTLKDNNLCFRHNKARLAGRAIRLFQEFLE